MNRTRRHLPILSAVLALFLGLFALGPTLDLALCAPIGVAETATDATAPVADAGADIDLDGCSEGGGLACLHGHCHPPADIPTLTLAARSAWSSTITLDPLADASSVPASASGLIRPPRA